MTEMDMDAVHELMDRVRREPSHLAKRDQLEKAGEELSMTQIGLALESVMAEQTGRDRAEVTKLLLQQALLLREVDKDVLAAGIACLTSLIVSTLVTQWGGIEEAYKSMADPELPLFPDVPAGAHCASCDGHACDE